MLGKSKRSAYVIGGVLGLLCACAVGLGVSLLTRPAARGASAHQPAGRAPGGPWHMAYTLPAGSSVNAVSCSSPSACTVAADGGYVATSTDPTGGASRWHQVRLPEFERLFGISCSNTTFCVTVGLPPVDSGGNLAVTADATAGDKTVWSEVRIGPYRTLYSVSCPSVALCVVGGEAGVIAASDTPIDGPWNVSTVSGAGEIAGVSCPTTTLCVAVDTMGNVLTTRDPLAPEQWRLTHIDDRPGNNFEAISCPSAGFCAAVDADGNVWTTQDPEGGTRAWTVRTIVGLPTTAITWGLSCASSSFCAVTASQGSFVASRDPTGGSHDWVTDHIPGVADLWGVSCPSSGFCLVGDTSGRVLVRQLR
jgi:hypothetical protein